MFQKNFKFSSNVPLPVPTAPKQCWSVDFIHDSLFAGRRFKYLTIVDDFSKESPRIEAAHGLGGHQLVRIAAFGFPTRGLTGAFTLAYVSFTLSFSI